MTTKKPNSPTWAELLEREPHGVLEVLQYISGHNPQGMQTLLRLQREGHPNLLLGVEDEDYDPEDTEMIGRGGVALIATEYARMLREGDVGALGRGRVALLDLPQGPPDSTLDERLEALIQAGAYIAEQIDQVVQHKAGL